MRTGEAGWAMLSDERLVARARGGDQPAFAELVRRHGASAWYLGLVATGSPEAATEAAGRGLMRAMATLDPGRWSPSEPFRAWLLRSVHHAATGGRPGAAPDLIDLTDGLHDDEDVAGVQPGPAAVAFAALPERQRAAIWMADVEALSVEEIARGLDLEDLEAARTLERGRVRFANEVGSWRDDQHFAHLPGALAAFAMPVPESLEEDVLTRWRTWVSLSRAPEPVVKAPRRSVRETWSLVRDDGLGARVAAAAAVIVFLLGAVGAAVIGSQGGDPADTPLAVDAGSSTTAAVAPGDPTTTADGETATTKGGTKPKGGSQAPQTTAGRQPSRAGRPTTTGSTRPTDDPENRRPGTTAPRGPSNFPTPPPPSTPTTKPRGTTTTTTRPRTTTTTTTTSPPTTEPTTTTTTSPPTTDTTTTTTEPVVCLPLICDPLLG